jgi:hypothetical protein
MVQPHRPQETVIIRSMPLACRITKATDAHRICNTAFPGQQWLHERASVLRYTHTACLVGYGAATNQEKLEKCMGSTVCCTQLTRHGSVSRPPDFTIWWHSSATRFVGLHSPKLILVGYPMRPPQHPQTESQSQKLIALTQQVMQNFKHRSKQRTELHEGYLQQVTSKKKGLNLYARSWASNRLIAKGFAPCFRLVRWPHV